MGTSVRCLPTAVVALLCLVAASTDAADAEGTIALQAPIDCSSPAGCIVRTFVDQDAGDDWHDFRCGRLTNDGHKGTDVRVPDGLVLAGGVAVLAAAPGVVLRLRDGMADVSVREIGEATIKDREAGNSIIIDHGDGWETQYGHLRRGSIVVEVGDRVAAGQPIALVGLSGNTEFTHLHFELRRIGQPIDPYTGAAMGSGCGDAGSPLWTETAAAQLPYREHGLFDSGFAGEVPDRAKARAGAYAVETLSRDSPALVMWIEIFGHRPGDRLQLRLLTPDGTALADKVETVADDHVQLFQYLGKRRPAAGWSPGVYRAEFAVERIVDGVATPIIAGRRQIELR